MIWKLPVEEMSSVLGTLKEAQNGENTEFQYQTKKRYVHSILLLLAYE